MRPNRSCDAKIDAILALAQSIRYVARYQGGALQSVARAGVSRASASESDRYEELLVNPTLLTLLRQRGEIDCGGLEFVIIRYGNFWQVVIPVDGGHLSVCIDRTADPLEHLPAIAAAIRS